MQNNSKCCVEFCQNTRANCDLTFFLIPRNDPARAEKWMKSLKLKPNLPKKKFVCSDHFEEKYFTSTIKKHVTAFAFPTLQFKTPKVEQTTWDKCKASKYLCKNSTSNSESPKDVLPDSKEAHVVASLHLGSENQPQIQQIFSASTIAATKITGNNWSTDKEIIDNSLKHQAMKRKAIEEEIDNYLKRRYHNEKNRKAVEQLLKEHPRVPKRKQFNKSKDKSGSFGDVVIKTEDSTSSVENQPLEEENAIVKEQLAVKTKVNPKVNLKQSVNFVSVLQQNINSKDITEQLSKKQSSNRLLQVQQLLQTESDKQQQTKSDKQQLQTKSDKQQLQTKSDKQQLQTKSDKQQLQTESNKQEQQLQTKSASVSELEAGDVYDKFAARIAEELKRMKNPYRRAKTLFYIERILYEAKSGAYDA